MKYTFEEAQEVWQTLSDQVISAFKDKDIVILNVYYEKIKRIQSEVNQHERLNMLMNKAILEAIRRPNGWEHVSMLRSQS